MNIQIDIQVIIVMFAVAMFGLCQSVDLYWKIKGFFKNRSKNKR